MITAIILLIIVYALNIIDYIETLYVINRFGIGVEVNPIGRFLFENNLAWAVKIIVMPIILALMGFLIKIDKRNIWVAYILLCVYLAVVVSNSCQILLYCC